MYGRFMRTVQLPGIYDGGGSEMDIHWDIFRT